MNRQPPPLRAFNAKAAIRRLTARLELLEQFVEQEHRARTEDKGCPEHPKFPPLTDIDITVAFRAAMRKERNVEWMHYEHHLYFEGGKFWLRVGDDEIDLTRLETPIKAMQDLRQRIDLSKIKPNK